MKKLLVILFGFACLALAQNPVMRELRCPTQPSGGTDSYACALSVAPANCAAIQGKLVSFLADVANTGAASLNLNSGACSATIVKLQGGTSTPLEDNDIRAGQEVLVKHDGTNFQMLSPRGNREVHAFGSSFDGGGSTLTAGDTVISPAATLPYGCTIFAWAGTVDAGTAIFKLLKVATGTAAPVIGDSINTSGVGVSSGTAVRSTTLSDFTTTTVTENDIFAVNLSAVTGSPTKASFSVQCR